MRGVVPRQIKMSDLLRGPPRGRDAIDLTGILGEKDDALAVPASAARLVYIAEYQRRAARRRNPPQLALRKESNVTAVGGPERAVGVIRADQRMRLEGIQGPHPELCNACGSRQENHIATIGGEHGRTRPSQENECSIVRRQNGRANHARLRGWFAKVNKRQRQRR